MPETEQFKQVKRFMVCDEGRQFLDGIRTHLKGHTIDDVQFVNNGGGVTTILRLNNGQCYAFNDEELCLETLNEQFSGLFREIAHNNTLARKGDKHDE
ncbi:MAG: hypothetical protein NTU83_08990 [Candidatus Hydrogenedentes bacterium]|nr:hypothetical protein [Candidatus Hydrogenedentota bacterium]